jgi:glycosyltransferase involved in cell wall biosynthesis
MQNANLVSILVPVYNTSRYLGKCLDSICNQTYQNLEIIVVNDGSIDGSYAIMKNFAKKDRRIKIFSKKNKGLSNTRNFCIKHASGNYILNVDSDDWIETECIEKLIIAAIKKKADIVVCDLIKDYNGKSCVIKEPYPEICNFETFFNYFILKNGINSIWNKLIKKNLYTENDICVYEDISLGEDATTLLRLITKATIIIHISFPLYHYSCFTQGMSQILRKNVMEYYNGLSKVYDYYNEQNINVDKFPLIRLKVAYVQLAYCTLRKAIKLGYNDYLVLGHLFDTEIRQIVKLKWFKQFSIKYKLFTFAYRVYLIFYSRYINKYYNQHLSCQKID